MAKLAVIRNVTSGQQLSRIIIEDTGKQREELKFPILSPSAVRAGIVDMSKITYGFSGDPSDLDKMNYQGKVTRTGDIVMKLSSPYEAALITDEEQGMVVPSFCCIIRDYYFPSEEAPAVPSQYLCAVLNSGIVKHQISAKMSGTKRPMLRISEINELEIPDATSFAMDRIGELFFITADNKMQLANLIETEEAILNACLMEAANKNPYES